MTTAVGATWLRTCGRCGADLVGEQHDGAALFDGRSDDLRRHDECDTALDDAAVAHDERDDVGQGFALT